MDTAANAFKRAADTCFFVHIVSIVITAVFAINVARLAMEEEKPKSNINRHVGQDHDDSHANGDSRQH